jgi:pimeloyl-ACP methyl ester carboxylesterase
VPPSYRIEDFAADLVYCLDELCGGRAALAGHSMGGRVSAWIAAHHPERVRALALLDTRMRGLERERVEKWRGATSKPRLRSVYATREQALQAFRLTPDEPGVEPAVRESLARHAIVESAPGQWSLCFDRAVLALEGSRLTDLVGLLGEIHCPSLLMRGANSTVVGESQSAEMARALGECPVRVFPGGHHFLLARPDEVAGALRARFDTLAG